MKKSFVLQALKIFGFEEMLKLSQASLTKASSMKKAAGAELMVWSDAPERDGHSAPEKEAAILPFRKPGTQSRDEMPEPVKDPRDASAKASDEAANFYSSEFMLWQRELSKDNTTPLKKDAVSGYARSTEMYVVKTPSLDGKEKIRFASTHGVLVNKKQA